MDSYENIGMSVASTAVDNTVPTEFVENTQAKSTLSEKELEAKKLEELKKTHGKVYVVKTELTEEDDDVKEVQYIFHRPAVAAYDRYVKNAGKGMNKALKTFLIDSVVPDDEEKLINDMEEYPALALGIGQKLLALMGLSDNVNLKKL